MKILLLLAASAFAWAESLAGSYSGHIVIKSADGDKESGALVVIQEKDGQLAITAGPDAGQQLPASNIKNEAGKLTFDVQPPNGPHVVQFDVQLKDGRLVGQLTMRRGDEKRTAALDLKKE